MATFKLLLLAGDGIGPEVMTEVVKVADWMAKAGIASFETENGLVGGAAYDAHGKAISESDMKLAMECDAVIFGAVGGPKWDAVPYDVRPEAGLLRLRKDLGLCLDESKRNGAHLPITALVDQFYGDVISMGGARWDTSSLVRRLRKAQ